jgi:adenosylmethionine-8-amino-7-oxononanoate aminotransferase
MIVTRGEGVWLETEKGLVLDAISSWWVIIHGHHRLRRRPGCAAGRKAGKVSPQSALRHGPAPGHRHGAGSQGFRPRLSSRDRPGTDGFCRQRGVLLRPLGNTMYVMLPYCITGAELDLVYDVIAKAAGRFA